MTEPSKVGYINSTSVYRSLLAQLRAAGISGEGTHRWVTETGSVHLVTITADAITMKPEGLNTSEQQGEH